jgi:hypothetical protein
MSELNIVIQELNKNNRYTHDLANSINKLAVEFKHSNDNNKRTQDKLEERVTELEEKEEARQIEEAKREGIEETQTKQKQFFINNWHKILMCFLAAAPVIVYFTQELEKAGVLK